MDESLLDFLRSRNIAEDTIQYIINEKIDAGVLILMDGTEKFKQLFTLFGDRIAVMDYCRRTKDAAHKRKLGLVKNITEILNKKKKKKEDVIETPASTSSFPNTQPQRNVELGWLCDVRCMKRKKKRFEFEEGLAQVRSTEGGGNKVTKMSKTSTKRGIIEEAKALFFPNGQSPLGKIEDFDCNLLDFKQCELPDEDLTVGQMYQLFKNKGTLRFYLSTWKRVDPVEDLEEHVPNDMIELHEYEIHGAEYEIPTAGDQSTLQNTRGHNESDELDANNLNLEEHSRRPTVIQVHRGQVYQEFLSIFASREIVGPVSVEMMNGSGEVERGVDTGGVLRDALSEFWSTFYELATEGTAYKVPILRHDMSESEWIAVARVLVLGWTTQRYFPLKLAPSFMEVCVFGTTSNNFREDLLKIVAGNERTVIESALTDFQNTDIEELIEALSQFEPKWLPTVNNIVQLINDIGHKEIIQKPKFVIDCWSSVLSGLMNRGEFQSIFNKNSATSKNIIPLLTTTCEHDSETLKVLGFLKKIVREAQEEMLEHFLRFVTGANIVTGPLTIEFNEETGFKRTPIAHTCASILNLSKKYDNFPDFRSEMNSVLNAKCWVMDIFSVTVQCCVIHR